MRSGRPHVPTAILSFAAFALLPACSDGPTPPPGNGDGNGGGNGNGELVLEVETVVDGLTRPTYLTAPEGDDRLFVLEQPGRVRIVRNGQLLATPYLDIADVVDTDGNEQGLLGMAFHPEFETNGQLYLDFTIDPAGATRVVRYTVADPAADVASVVASDTILEVGQPFSNHNGGMLAFGPDDRLYVALGDGGSGGDPQGNGQDSTTVLGTIVRLEPDGTVPADNPFVGRSGDDRIWAYGLRNPWRFAFDPPSSTLFIADVGQNSWEEVNAVDDGRAGVNYGWNVMEGMHCFGGGGCDQTGLELPVLEYGHDEGCSITGGFVYRGSAVSAAEGRYFFADLCSGFVRSFLLEGGEATDVVEDDLGDLGQITSFGTDGAGELYVLEGGGRVLRLVEGDE